MAYTSASENTAGYPAGFEIRSPVRSFGRTVYEVVSDARGFYSRLETERSEYPAMVFLYILAALVTLLATSVEAATGSTALYPEFFVGSPEGPGFFPEGIAWWEVLRNVVGLSLLAPVFVIVGNYAWAFVVHALAWFYMGRRAGNIRQTFRVIAYSNAVGIVALVPVVGATVATIWALVLLVIGVRRLNPRAAGHPSEPESAV